MWLTESVRCIHPLRRPMSDWQLTRLLTESPRSGSPHAAASVLPAHPSLPQALAEVTGYSKYFPTRASCPGGPAAAAGRMGQRGGTGVTVVVVAALVVVVVPAAAHLLPDSSLSLTPRSNATFSHFPRRYGLTRRPNPPHSGSRGVGLTARPEHTTTTTGYPENTQHQHKLPRLPRTHCPSLTTHHPLTHHTP
ncbi:hypothetical protein E2C01_101616 [Portunus trituberculatus]|uniref:Uncharacterized protein n=1 Tax=Portunus trituberculatus TaxID=210409 RepID=A0A5B7KGI0_PORTR|nr:hypothetical protein [Portunus trituberculatus]